MADGESKSKGPLFNLLFSDILVGRVVQHKQDHREGVIRFPVYQDYTNNYAATYAVRFADSAYSLEEVPADKLSISGSFAEDNTLVPASILELQRHNWYQPRFTTNGLESLLGMSPPPPASATNATQQQPQLPSQPMPSPPPEVDVGTVQAAGLLRNLRTGAASRKQPTRASSLVAASAAAAAGKKPAPASQEKEQLPQAAPPGPPAPAAPASKRQVSSQQRAPQPAPPAQDSPGLQYWFGEQSGLQPEQGAAGGEEHTGGGARKRRARRVSELAASEPSTEDWVQGWTGTRYPKSAAYKPGDVPTSSVVVEEGTFEVEQILDEYTLNGKKWYLPKWKGYELRPGSGATGLTSGDPTQKGDWEPEWCIPKTVINRWKRERPRSHSGGDSPAAASVRSRKKR